MVVIKVTFGGDLRRISLDEGVSFHEATEKLKKLYSLPLTACGLDVVHITDKGSKEVILGERKFQKILEEANNTKQRIIRLELQSTNLLLYITHPFFRTGKETTKRFFRMQVWLKRREYFG